MKNNCFAIDNARLWIGNGESFGGYLTVLDGVIAEVGKGGYQGDLPALNANGHAVSPGLIDLMVLGGFGCSVLRDDPLRIAREYLKLGVTACQFCTGNLPWDDNLKVARNIAQAKEAGSPDAARILGLYMEGPFMQPNRTGAGLSKYSLPPNEENINRFMENMGEILTMINISPSTPGDVDAIRKLSEAGVVVSMAHSDADVEQVNRCIEAGTSILGHVFCNNPALIVGNVQQPTIDHVGLTDERIKFVHLICDAVHTAPTMIRLINRCRGSEAIILVTDGIPLAGCPDGDFTWDDGRIFTKGGGVGRTAEGWLMGSATLLPDMLRNFVKITGVSPHEAIRTVTYNPAVSLGLDEEIGILDKGRAADLVLWDAQLNIKRVWKSGREISHVSDFAEVSL